MKLQSLLAALLALGTASQAASTGFNQTAAGPWDYNDSANWASSTINGLWNTDLTLAAAQTATFATDTTLTTGLTFNYAGNYALTLKSTGGVNRTVTLGGDISVAPASNQTVTIGSITANQYLNMDLGGVTRTMTVAASKMLTLVNVASNGAIIKAGDGTLTLSSAVPTGGNTFIGGTTLNAGILDIVYGGTVGVSGPLGNGGTFTINGGTINNSTGGKIVANVNPITISGDFAFGTANSGSTLTFPGAVSLAADRTITLNGPGAWTLGGLWSNTGDSVRTLTVNNGSGTVGYTSTLLTIGSYNLTGTGSTAARMNIINGTGNVTISGAVANGVSAGSGLTYSGTGTLTLSGTNTYTGGATLNSGTLLVKSASALGTVAGTFVINGGTLDSNGQSMTANNPQSWNGDFTYSGASGTLSLGTGAVTMNATRQVTVNASTLTVGGIISGSGLGLTKTGAGILTLSGANAYTGATTVNNGLLRITGSTNASSAVTVNAGAIGGSGNGTTTGMIKGNVTLGASGGIDLHTEATPAVGTLTISGDLAINGSAGANRLFFDLGAGANLTDKIVVTGNTTMSTSGAGVITLSQIGGVATRINAGTYTLIQGTGAIPTLGDFTLATTQAFGSTFSLGVSGNNLQLTVGAGTPGSAATSWSSESDPSWATVGNWTAGVPGYSSVVTFSGTAATSTTLDGDYDIKGLTYATSATTATTIAKGTGSMLTLEGSGITVNTPTAGTVTHTINANVGIAASQTWTVNYTSALNNAMLTVGGNVTDFGAGFILTKAGTGTLNLNGATAVGSLYVGNNIAAGSVVVGTGGILSVGRGSSDNLYVGAGTATSSGILDVSAATSFAANVGKFHVGYGGNNSTGTLNLSADNTITAATEVRIGWAENPASIVGSVTTPNTGTTRIHTPLIGIGGSKATGTFTLGSSATLNVDGLADSRAALIIGRHTYDSGTATSGTLNLSGGTAVLKLSQLVVGQKVGSNSPPVSGSMTLGSSASNHLDISGVGNVVLIADAAAAAATAIPTLTGTLTIGNLDATSAITSTDNSTAILIAAKTIGGTVTGTLNLNGGTLTLTTARSAIAGGTGGTSNLTLGGLTSGAVTLKPGASSTTWIQNLTSAKINTGGVIFDTNSYNITIPQALLENATSTGGGLTKAGAGTLTLSGGNTYTGATRVSNGTLTLGALATLATASVELAPGAVLDTSAQAAFAIPGATPVTVHLPVTGAAGKIMAAGLDISAANVTLTVDGLELNESVYVLAEYTALSGTAAFASVTTLEGYSIDYDYLGNKQIALVKDIAGGYDTWANTNITLKQPGALAGPGDDPDGDGSDNLTEYAFSGDPLSGTDNPKAFSQVLVAQVDHGQELVLTVAVLKGMDNFAPAGDGLSLAATSVTGAITYTIEGSDNLIFPGIAVTEVNDQSTQAMKDLLPVDSAYEYRSFVLEGSENLPTKGFLRAKVVK